jgi:type II secretion system protein N
MSPRLRRIAAWVGYPVFYIGCLLLFSYVSAPWERVRTALVTGFNGSPGLHLEVQKLTWAWRFPGIVAKGVKLVGAAPAADPGGKPKAAPEYVVNDFYARVSFFPLLWGTTKIAFALDGFGGSIDGAVKSSSDGRDINIELEDVDGGKLPYLAEMLGVPLQGAVTGKIDLRLPQDKLTQAEGAMELHIAGFVIGDGKTKIRDTIALPKVNAGQFNFKAEVTDGNVKLTELSTKGSDLQVVSDGRIRLAERFDSSLAELNLRFKFADAYKNKDDVTRSIFGAPGSTVPGLFDLDPKMKRAKRDDGFYAWRITGPLLRLSFQPASAGVADAGGARARKPAGRADSPPEPAAD